MTTSLMLSDRAERHISKIVAKWYHGTETLDRKRFSKTAYTIELNARKNRPISRARMFSPSSWVSDVREFWNQVIESRKKKGIKVLQEKETSDRYSIQMNDWREIDQQQFETVKKIHSNLIDKTSSLVERAKQSRFLGFFSPRRLRNRIKLGNFSQILWSKIITKRKALSPWSIS